jgi:hypothetical protein
MTNIIKQIYKTTTTTTTTTTNNQLTNMRHEIFQ